MHYKDYDVTVVNTITGTQGKGSSLSFIAVYELKDGYRFSEYISPEMYSSIEKGDNITVSLRPFDVKQTWFDNIVWFFGMALVQSICGTYIVCSILFRVISKIE
ncbi:putative 15.3 kDa protein [Salmonella phage Lv5cm]|nr:putative 15.3 kDa protein [Salmonella phage Lv5cm]